MLQKILRLAAAITFMLSSISAQALPFNSFDPRSMAMGGTGVATADPSTAPFFNPALLSTVNETKKFSVEFPVIGVRAYDPDNLVKSMDDFQKGNYVYAFTHASTQFNNNQTVANLTTLVNSMGILSTQVKTLSNKNLAIDAGAAFVIGVPGKSLGWAFYTDATVTAGGMLNYTDDQQIQNWVAATTSITGNCFNGNTLNTTAALTPGSACNNAIISNKYYSVSPTGSITQNFDPNTNLTSKIQVRGVLIGEVGMSLSHAFVSSDNTLSLGMTPKALQLQLFDALLDVNSGNANNATGNDYLAKYSAFNFDFGVANLYRNGWRTGVVIKNVLPQTYDFKRAPTPGATPVATGSTLSLKPQARVGISRETNWYTLALDADLTQNDPAGLENKTQYIALGGEFNTWNWLQLRAGYRADLVNTARSVASVGLGVSPRIPFLKLHADIALAGNASEVGASFRLGVNF